MLATREIPKPATMPKSKGRTQQLARTIPIIPPLCLLKAPSLLASPPPARALALKWPPTLPPRLHQSNGLSENTRSCGGRPGDTHGLYVHRLVLTPSISSVSSSCVVKDDTTGLVYMDTVTTSIGRVVLGKSDSNEGPIIEDITDQSWEASLKSAAGQIGHHPLTPCQTFLEPAIKQMIYHRLHERTHMNIPLVLTFILVLYSEIC